MVPMEHGPELPEEAAPERPPWSVLAGEFDPEDPRIKLNSILVARMVDSIWFNPIRSDNRRRMYAIELVLRAYELCGLDRFNVTKDVNSTAADLSNYSKQLELSKLTPELDIEDEKKEHDKPSKQSPSPVMNALRALMELSNNVSTITIQNRVRTEKEKEKWEVDGDTRRLAEAVVRSFYLKEMQQYP